MKLIYVERGIHRRGRRLIVSFALADGRIERRSVGLVSVEEARRRLLNWKHDVDMGTYQKKQPRGKPEPKVVVTTCKVLWDLYILNYRVIRERKDESRLTTAWEHLEGTFASMPVADVITKLIEEYVAARRGYGAANGTINRELALLHAMFRYGTRVTPPMVDRVPAFPSRLQEPPPRKGFVDDQKYNILARNAKDLWMRALIACYYNFGFRKGEMLNLRREQVDLDDRKITLYADQTKTEKARKVKMTNEVYELLAACCHGKKPDDYVFTRADGSRVVDLRQEWYELCVASKLGTYVRAKRRKSGAAYDRYVGLNLHDFRRSAIRNMVRRGVSDTVAMKISGHKTRGIFDRYNISDEKDLEKASALIEAGAERETQPMTSTDTKTYTRPLARTARPS